MIGDSSGSKFTLSEYLRVLFVYIGKVALVTASLCSISGAQEREIFNEKFSACQRNDTGACHQLIALATNQINKGRGAFTDLQYVGFLVYRAAAFEFLKDYPQAIDDTTSIINLAKGNDSLAGGAQAALTVRGAAYAHEDNFELALQDLLSISDPNGQQAVLSAIDDERVHSLKYCGTKQDRAACSKSISLHSILMDKRLKSFDDDYYLKLLLSRSASYCFIKDYSHCIADATNGIDIARRLNLAASTVALLEERGEAYAMQNSFDPALRDYNEALHLSQDAQQRKAIQVDIAMAERAKANTVRSTPISPQSRRYACQPSDGGLPFTLAIDPVARRLQIDSTAGNLGIHCTQIIRDGVTGPVNVGPGANICGGLTGNAVVHQQVTINGNDLVANITGNGIGGQLEFGLDTKLLRSSAGVAQCR